MKVRKSQAGEKGYVLVSVMLLITVMIIAMSMQINSIVQQIKRDEKKSWSIAARITPGPSSASTTSRESIRVQWTSC